MKLFLIIGVINVMLVVVFGVFGVYGLEGKILEKYLEVWKIGVQYQMFYVMGLFVIVFLLNKFFQFFLLIVLGWIMFVGIVLFLGSFYVLSMFGIKVFGVIILLGGVVFIVVWILIVVVVVKWL